MHAASFLRAFLSFKRGAQGGLPAFTRGKAGGSGTLAPLLRVSLGGGQTVPRLNAHKPHRLCRGRPDERVGVAFHIAGDLAAGALLIDANGLGAQARHAEAVVCEQIIRQLDGLLVLPLIIALARQQAVRTGIQNDRAFRLVKPELVIRGGVLCIKGDVERRVIADAKAQLFGAGVAHRQRMVHGLAVQTEGAGEYKVEGEAFGFDGIIRAQLQLDGIALGLEQGVLHVAGKAVLTALVRFAVHLKGTAGQLARPREQNGSVALPHSRVGLPEQLFPRRIFQADCAIIMTHGDDDGLILPPAVAPIQVVVVPIAAHKPGVSEKAAELAEKISKYARVKLDDSDNAPGWKFSQWEMKGVPLRLEIGPKDLEKNQCVLVRRDTREKIFVSLDELETAIPAQLEALRKDLYQRALANREKRTWAATTMEEVKELAKANTGYIKTMWCGDLACEMKMKEEAGLSSRCMPFEQEHISDVCPCCGKPASKMVYWGVAY